MPWIKILRSRQVEQAGVTRNLHPGDWIEVGKQTAMRWIADGSAAPAQPLVLEADLRGCGALVMTRAGGGAPSLAVPQLSDTLKMLSVETSDEYTLRYARTLFWNPDYPLRPELVPLGFRVLDAWEVAVPVVSYDMLALHIGTPDERARTEAVIRDLRVMCYHPSLMFVRRCKAGKDFLQAWNEERASGDDERLALLRAIYRVKPLLCALPATWNRTLPAIA